MRIKRNALFYAYCVIMYGDENMDWLRGSCKSLRKNGKVDGQAVVDAGNDVLSECLDNPEDWLLILK